MKADMYITDFDGTVILENSSRVFEKIILKHSHKNRYLTYLMFFSKFEKYFDYLFHLISNMTSKTDLRLQIFLILQQEIIKKEYSTIIDEVTHSLNINKKVYLKIKKKEFAILSNGLYPIIKKFSKYHKLNPKCIIASKGAIQNGRLVINLRSLKDKTKYLQDIRSFIYLSDNHKEITDMMSALNITNVKAFNAEGITLYELQKFDYL